MRERRSGGAGLAIAATFGLAWLAVPRVTVANCAMPGTSVEPPSGTAVPPDPVLYVFGGSSRYSLRIEVVDGEHEDAQVPASIERLSGRNDRAVYRIAVERVRPGPIRLRITPGAPNGSDTLRVDYTIDPSWKRPEGDALAITDASYFDDSGMAEASQELMLQPSIEAPAYRIEGWLPDGTRAVKRSILLEPHDMRAFYLYLRKAKPSGATPVEDEPPRPAMILLGQTACNGRWFTLAQRGIKLRVMALLSDGSEVASDELDLDALVVVGTVVGFARGEIQLQTRHNRLIDNGAIVVVDLGPLLDLAALLLGLPLPLAEGILHVRRGRRRWAARRAQAPAN